METEKKTIKKSVKKPEKKVIPYDLHKKIADLEVLKQRVAPSQFAAKFGDKHKALLEEADKYTGAIGKKLVTVHANTKQVIVTDTVPNSAEVYEAIKAIPGIKLNSYFK